MHVASGGHEVLQCPAEQSTLQAPPPQYVRHRPPEQSSVHEPEAGHVSAQLPPEQSVVHGDEAQVALQLPEEQEHVAPEQEALLRPAAVPGSATDGPPLGLPDVVVVPEPPHAQRVKAASVQVLSMIMLDQ